jgi:hypothetical protein
MKTAIPLMILSMVIGVIFVMIDGFILGTSVAETVMEHSGSILHLAYITVLGIIVMFTGAIEIVSLEDDYDTLSNLKKES